MDVPDVVARVVSACGRRWCSSQKNDSHFAGAGGEATWCEGKGARKKRDFMLAPRIRSSGATLRLALVATTSGTTREGALSHHDVVSLYRARETLRDLGLSVSVGALERWTETGRLPVVAHVPRGKRKITLVSLNAARAVVEAPALKRRAEDDELERAYKEGLTPVEAAARAGLTMTDGGARKRLKQLGMPVRTASETRKLKLELYRREYDGLLTTAELADVVPCSIVTVLRHRRAAEDGVGAFHGSDLKSALPAVGCRPVARQD